MQFITNIFLLIILYTLKAIKYIFAFILHTKHIINYFSNSKRSQK
jgi:hypothetical protein